MLLIEYIQHDLSVTENAVWEIENSMQTDDEIRLTLYKLAKQLI
jgi:hypothetical protein